MHLYIRIDLPPPPVPSLFLPGWEQAFSAQQWKMGVLNPSRFGWVEPRLPSLLSCLAAPGLQWSLHDLFHRADLLWCVVTGSADISQGLGICLSPSICCSGSRDDHPLLRVFWELNHVYPPWHLHGAHLVIYRKWRLGEWSVDFSKTSYAKRRI